MVEIPITTGGGNPVTLSCNVGGVSLSVRLLWNGRDGHWFADFESSEGRNYGIRLVPLSPLLGVANACLPEGDLVLLPEQPDPFAPESVTFDNLGEAFRLHYVDSDDIGVFKAAGVF